MNLTILPAKAEAMSQALNLPIHPVRQTRGFALIATLPIMILLLMLAISLLSLSTLTTRNSIQGSAQMEAQSNARLALMMAIGRLQQTMGPDRCVSARGVSMANHPALGATVTSESAQGWWVGVASSNPSETIGTNSKSVVWLVSGLNPLDSAENQISSPTPFTDREVIMYGENTIDLALTGGQSITAGIVPISDQSTGTISGSYAYFVDDNGMKAQLAATHPDLLNDSSNQERSVISGTYDLSILDGMSGMSGVLPSDYLKLNSINDLPFLGSNATTISRDKRMSYTTRSLGVLADVKNGGLKKDLTIAFEKQTTTSANKNGGSYPNMPTYPVFDAVFAKSSDSDWGDYLLLDESKRGEFAEQGYIHWAMLRDYYNMKRYIRKQDGYDCLAPVTLSEASMHGSLSGFDYCKGIIAPHVMGLASAAGETPPAHHSLPYGDYNVLPSRNGLQSEEYIEYYKHSPIIPILSELQYNMWLEKAPATPTDERGTPKKPTTTESLQTNVQVWTSHYNPYNIRLLCAGNNQRYSFAGHYMPQAVFRIPGIQLDGFYGNRGITGRDFTQLQGLQSRNESRAYIVDGTEQLGPGRAMVCAFENDFLIEGSASAAQMKFGSNVRDLITEKAYRRFNIDGVLPPSLDWEIDLQDNGTLSHGVNHHSSYTSAQFLWDAFPKNGNGRQYIFDNLPSSRYNDNSKLCFNVRLRTTKEAGSSIRPLVDANIRSFFLNKRWDEPLGLGMISAYTAVNSEDDPGLGRVPQMSTQSSGKGHGYWGAEHGPFLGHDRVILFDVPREDLVSLGQLQHANVGRFGYEPSYVIGNSYSNPRIPLGEWKASLTDTTNTRNNIPGSYALYDASYLVNETLWDGHIFTTIPQEADNYDDPEETDPDEEHFAKLLTREELLPNPRFIPYVPQGSSFDMATLQAESAVNTNAGHLLVDGAFNVNSTSVDAWEAFLSGTQGMPYQKMDDKGAVTGYEPVDGGKVRFPRLKTVYGEKMTTASPDENYWVGFRALEQSEVRELAEAIVAEVKLRGPFLSMGEFVNRKLEDNDLGHMGALQAALDKTVNRDPLVDYDQRATNPALPPNSNQAAGFPGQLLQGDILQALSPCMTVRSDTFTIRAYGESLNPSTGAVVAKAWCEATVQRYPDPVEAINSGSFIDELAQPSSPFGRRFQITSFRWLNPGEI